jgi:glycosyltransferase involved in cell wall biosynthesis
MTKKPLISCLCISNGRAKHLKKAIAYYKAQTYPNKELIIVSGKHDLEYEEVIESWSDNSIKYHYHQNDSLTLGELRNVAIEKSNGEYFCVWDDDDWYHYKRLEIQFKELIKSKKKGVVLPYVILLDAVNKEAHLSVPVLPPASLLCKKSIITQELLYPSRNKAEDTVFLYTLFQKNLLYPLTNPILYIYVYHGNNTWNLEHFSRPRGYKFSETATQLIMDVVDGKYSCKEASVLLGSSKMLAEMDYFGGFIMPDTTKKGIQTLELAPTATFTPAIP